ncbi:helix-turn-helix domain-containing protein [Gordonia sp. MP11Mi]|uniref:HTH cro/C1-type domain-containing protein n=1 Tax=Gordonia sp. MP11Mi TaxID=3022769 RepID=A0AA97GUS5_9ACTN
MAESKHRDDSWIGRRVAQHRKDRGWTLTEVADKVGLSSTQLSRIESGTRQSSIGTLIEIAHAFGVSLSQLVDEQFASSYHVTRVDDRVQNTSANGSLASLSGAYPGLQAIHLTIVNGTSAPDARHVGEEWLYVLSGTVDVRIGADSIALGVGDAIHFPSQVAHQVSNPVPDPAEILLVSTAHTG